MFHRLYLWYPLPQHSSPGANRFGAVGSIHRGVGIQTRVTDRVGKDSLDTPSNRGLCYDGNVTRRVTSK